MGSLKASTLAVSESAFDCNHLAPQKYAWKCRAAGHTTWQTVQHRRQPRGCTECEQEKRILVEPSLPDRQTSKGVRLTGRTPSESSDSS